MRSSEDPNTAFDAHALAESFRTIAEAVPLLVFTALADGTIEYLNSAVYDYVGRPRRASTAWGWHDIVHPDDVEPYMATWHAALERGDTYEARVRLSRRDGEYRWFLTRGVAVRDPASGAIARWFVTATDVHEHFGAAARSEFVARAEALFASELDSEAILRAVVGAAVASFSDYCFVDLADESGALHRAYVDHRDPVRRDVQQRSIGERIPGEHPVHPVGAADGRDLVEARRHRHGAVGAHARGTGGLVDRGRPGGARPAFRRADVLP